LPVMESSLPQFNGPKNLHALALSGNGNLRGTTNPAPGGVQGESWRKLASSLKINAQFCRCVFF
jgi:hypothetical protein